MGSRYFRRNNRYIAAWILRRGIRSYGNIYRVWLGRDHGNIYENQGCLGLRLRLPNGNEAITTTTHAFVELIAVDNVSRIRYQASDWLVRTIRLLRELKPVKRFLEIPQFQGSDKCKTAHWAREFF